MNEGLPSATFDLTKIRSKKMLTHMLPESAKLRAFHADVPTCQLVLGAYVLTCQLVLRALVLTC